MQDFRMDTFLAVCKFMNFTKAAAYLNMTQPAVSQHIRFLSQSYGVDLFIMEGKRLQLTEAGKILQQAALNMKHDEQHMRERMLQTKIGLTNYAFGATLSVAEFMLVEDLRNFLHRHPDSHVRMQVGNTQDLLQLLGTSELDFAIVEGAFPKAEYAFLPYKQEAFVAVGSPAKAKQYAGASVRNLLQETVFLREPGSGTRNILEDYLEQQGLSVQDFATRVELGNIGAIKYMLQDDLGISFCYHAAIKQEEKRGELAVIPLRDLHLFHEINFIYRKASIFQEDYRKIYYALCGCCEPHNVAHAGPVVKLS